MSTVDEYHKLARDCLRWAARARTEKQRKRLLNLAHDWTQAASGLAQAQRSQAGPARLLLNSASRRCGCASGSAASITERCRAVAARKEEEPKLLRGH
jgi:hypothetical protein